MLREGQDNNPAPQDTNQGAEQTSTELTRTPNDADLQQAVDHFDKPELARYDIDGGVDVGDDPESGLGKELQDRRDEADEAEKKKKRRVLAGGITGGLAVVASVASIVAPGGSGDVSTTPLRDADKPALTIPNNPSLAPSPQQQVQYNGVHTADAPMDQTLPTAPEDKQFGQQMAEQNEQAEQRAAEVLDQETGGARFVPPSGGAPAQTQ